MNNKAKELINLIEESEEAVIDVAKQKAQQLTDKQKFELLTDVVKTKKITNPKAFSEFLRTLGWDERKFLDTFEDLFNMGTIGFDTIKILNTSGIFNAIRQKGHLTHPASPLAKSAEA